MATDMNPGNGHPENTGPKANPPSLNGNAGAIPAAKSHPPTLEIKSPNQAQNDASARDGAQELEAMLNRAVSQIDESERNYVSALGDLSSELGTLSQKTAETKSKVPDDAALTELDDQVSNLNQQIKNVDTNLHDEENTDVLHEMERQIAALAADPNTNPTVGGMPAPAPSVDKAALEEPFSESTLDDQFRSVTGDLEQSLKTAAPAHEVQAAADETRQIAQSLTPAAGPNDLDSISQRLRGVEDSLARAEQQHARIASIENHILKLVETSRSSDSQMQNLARQSAREAAELVQSQGGQMSAAERLDAIQAELRGLNERAAQMAERTVGTLEAMHGALKNLCDKVGPGSPLPGMGAPSTGDRRPPQSQGHAEVKISRGPERPGGGQGGGPGAAGDPSNIGATIPDYQPTPQSPATRPAAEPALTEAHLNAAASAPDRTLGDDDFIASARRAAEAAARQPAATGTHTLPGSLPRPQNPAQAQTGAAAPDADKKPQSILLIAAVALLVVSAALFYKRLSSEGSISAVDGPVHLIPGKKAPTPLIPGKTPARIPDAEQSGAPTKQGAKDLPADHLSATAGAASNDHARSAIDLPYHLTGANDLPAARFSIVESARRKSIGQTPANAPNVSRSAKKVRKATPAQMPPENIGALALRKAAANGQPRAQFEVARRFAKGKTVERDFAEAARWYMRAASQGFAPAQYRLAALYERGRGLKRDVGRARIWYQRSAEAGNVKAMHNLAVLYTKTPGKSPDYASASQWFAKAARHGLSDSQFNLGILHENGLGLPKDLKRAYKWFLLAAKAGDQEATKRAQGLALQFHPNEKAEIEKSAEAWTAKTATAAANRVKPAAKAWSQASSKPDALVARAQALLNQLGYDAGTADGLMGPKTKAAIQAFQSSVGLDRTGRASRTLVTQLEMRTG